MNDEQQMHLSLSEVQKNLGVKIDGRAVVKVNLVEGAYTFNQAPIKTVQVGYVFSSLTASAAIFVEGSTIGQLIVFCFLQGVQRNPKESKETTRNPKKPQGIQRHPKESKETPRNPKKSQEIQRDPKESKEMMTSNKYFHTVDGSEIRLTTWGL